MAAQPAWPPRSTSRMFIDQRLSIDMPLMIDGKNAHYLLKVMRAKQGDPIKLFDNQSGEYLATITDIGKRDLGVHIESLLRPREETPDLWLLQAPIKKDRFDWIAEKSCELGISLFQPVLTSRCIVNKVKEERLQTHMIEAAEQCERTALPQINPLKPLSKILEEWPQDRTLFFCDERGGNNFKSEIKKHDRPAAILIGPEGGFTDEENEAIRQLPQAVAVSLGPRILRADTAAITAISAWMTNATASDWVTSL